VTIPRILLPVKATTNPNRSLNKSLDLLRKRKPTYPMKLLARRIINKKTCIEVSSPICYENFEDTINMKNDPIINNSRDNINRMLSEAAAPTMGAIIPINRPFIYPVNNV